MVKPKKGETNPKKESKPKLNMSYAYVYKGHIVAFNEKTVLFINMKEYLKYSLQIEDDENPSDAFSLISKITEKLDGRKLSGEFFSVFSKTQKIVGIEEDLITVDNNGFISDYSIDSEYDVDLLEDMLSKAKTWWTTSRTEQGEFAVRGSVFNTLSSVFKGEIENDSLIFERTLDDKARFALINKDFIFGVTEFDFTVESSITKFGEANDFFELSVD